MMIITLISVLLSISLLFNLHLFLKIKKTPLSRDAHQLLHDLHRGGAVLRVTPIDPENILEWRG